MSPAQRAWLALLYAAIAVQSWIAVLTTPEGTVPLLMRNGLVVVFGRSALIVPLGFTLGGLLLVCGLIWPRFELPWRRLVGVVLIALACLPAQHLLWLGFDSATRAEDAHEGGGWVGYWTVSMLVREAGSVGTVLVLLVVLLTGAMLTFSVNPARGIRLRRIVLAPRPRREHSVAPPAPPPPPPAEPAQPAPSELPDTHRAADSRRSYELPAERRISTQ